MERLTTTIKRKWLSQIVAKTKKIEYREIKKYWNKRLKEIKVPFELRMINGMQKKAPEVTVLIKKIRKNISDGVYELHIGKVLSFKNWDKKRKQPR